MKRVVVVDDDSRTRRILQILLERMGLESKAFEDAREALEFLSTESVSLILSDLKMPGMDGLEFMRALRALDAEVPVMVLTAYGTVDAAVEAMKLGALDFVSKPFDVDAIEVLVKRALVHSRHRTENLYLREASDRTPGLEEIVGDSPAMQAVLSLVRKVAPTRSAVLITGETGTGKELVAHAIHELSPRENELFVPLNCSAIPGELLESELFGHTRGAFSGAHADRIGKFQAADGGTLFLDEIGDMDLRLQAKLLRVLQEGVIEPVGSNRRIQVDVRIISSTNRDLEAAIRDGNFREDLFYRLNVFRFELPPLRDRPEDLVDLAHFFLARFGQDLGKPGLVLGTRAAQSLREYAWPGNVRELRNLMERAAVLAENRVIQNVLGPGTGGGRKPTGHDDSAANHASNHALGASGDEPGFDLAEAVAETERRTILRALAATQDHKPRAAKLLGIGERTLFTKLKKHGI